MKSKGADKVDVLSLQRSSSGDTKPTWSTGGRCPTEFDVEAIIELIEKTNFHDQCNVMGVKNGPTKQPTSLAPQFLNFS